MLANSSKGYWVPYEAAKAIAARFCWNIRYVLTPVFGVDFPSTCIPPEDPKFLKFGIDKTIVQNCTALAKNFRAEMVSFGKFKQQSTYNGVIKSLRPQPLARPDYESGYGTDPDRSLPNSPQSYGPGWRAVNAPSIGSPDPIYVVNSIEPKKALRKHHPDEDKTESASPLGKRRRTTKLGGSEDGESFDHAVALEPHVNQKIRYSSKAAEARAAYTLVQLHEADATFAARVKSLGRRASY